MKKRFATIVTMAVMGALTLSLPALADAPDTEPLAEGEYTLLIPGVGDFVFSIDLDPEEGEDSVSTDVAAVPDGYEIDDDDPLKVSWKHETDETEVEAKEDKVEADVVWNEEGDTVVTLGLPGGGSVTITRSEDGSFDVSASDGWWAFGHGSDWYVADAEVFDEADTYLKVEVNDSGVEIKRMAAPEDGFEEEPEEGEVETEVEDGDGEGKKKGHANKP